LGGRHSVTKPWGGRGRHEGQGERGPHFNMRVAKKICKNRGRVKRCRKGEGDEEYGEARGKGEGTLKGKKHGGKKKSGAGGGLSVGGRCGLGATRGGFV